MKHNKKEDKKMAKGDRVRINQTSEIVSESGDKLVFVYQPRFDGKNMISNPDGTHVIECKGGITAGSFGFINGEPIKISKASLKEFSSAVPGFHGVDTTILIPIFLEKYQTQGWFPADNVKIVAGGVA